MRCRTLFGRPVSIIISVIVLGTLVGGEQVGSAGLSGGAQRPVLSSPVRIASHERGPLLVSDTDGASVCMLNRTTLEVQSCFAVPGRPVGIAWFRGHILVGNETTGRLEWYSNGGRLLRTSAREMVSPTDIAVHEASGKIFVVDSGSHDIKVIGPDGQLVQLIVGNGASGTSLVTPVAIAVDEVRGELLVSDYGDPSLRYRSAIRVYDLSGNFVASIPGRTGGFSRPQGLAVGNDRIYVVDSLLGQIIVFDRSTGERVGTIGSFGDGEGQLMLPLDVLLDRDTGELFVTNNRRGRIDRFLEGGVSP